LITFKNTICNKLSPLEFENMLVQDAIAIQETPLEDNIELIIPISKSRARN